MRVDNLRKPIVYTTDPLFSVFAAATKHPNSLIAENIRL